VAPNIGTMLVSRFLDGFAGSAFLSVAGGTVGDMFAKHELSLPVCGAWLEPPVRNVFHRGL
jgi:MFS family permease